MEKIIKQIEQEENIKILFLIESGSRAWDWESKDSDYDIRGVFVQDYLKVTDIKTQIDRKIDDKDITLWDLRKFLQLMIKSNPSVWEWLSSNVVYLEHPIRLKLKKLFETCFSTYALKKHYSSMARQNFEKYINEIGDKANLKKYVYVLRSIVCVDWIEKYGTPPPKKHQELLHLLQPDIKKFFNEIVRKKKKSESTEGSRNPQAEAFIMSHFNKEFEKDKSKFDLDEINSIFKRIVNTNGKKL